MKYYNIDGKEVSAEWFEKLKMCQAIVWNNVNVEKSHGKRYIRPVHTL